MALEEHKIRTSLQDKIHGIVWDMSKYTQVPLPECRFDTIIHNAGMLSRDNLLNMNESKFLKMIAINTMSPIYLTKSCLPYMINKNQGNMFFFCPPYRIDKKTRKLTPYMQTKLAQTTFMFSLANMMTKIQPRTGIPVCPGIRVAGFWTDYPIWTDALKHRKIGQKENCMSPAIIGKTVELMLEDKPENIHGNVMIDHDYLKDRKSTRLNSSH